MILFIIVILASSAYIHVVNKSHMQYAREFLELIVFNWSEGVLVNMKEKLTKEKDGRLKNSGYGLILIYFYLEWIPLLGSQHVPLEPVDLRVPWMRR